MKYYLLFFSFIILSELNAQNRDVYPLHPSVGDTIDVTEKLDYSLFPIVENTNFKSATIKFENDTFFLVVDYEEIDTSLTVQGAIVSVYTSSNEFPLNQDQIIEEQKKIEKVNAYYRLMAEEKKKEKEQPTNYTKNTKKYPVRLEGAMSEQMKKQARMNIRLKEDSRRQQEFEMGLRPREMRIEFK